MIPANEVCSQSFPFRVKLDDKHIQAALVRVSIQTAAHTPGGDKISVGKKGQRPDFIESDLMNYLPPDKKAMYEALKFEGGGGEGGGEGG